MKRALSGVACLLLAAATGIAAPAPDQVPGDGELTLLFESNDPYQVLFLVGIGELREGNYAAAAKILRALYRSVKTQRVQLELARALFLDRRYRESETLFRAVYEDPDVPLNVRENIKLYLDEIDAVLGTLKFAFAIISDSNPLELTDAGRVTIAGQRFLFVRPAQNKRVLGAEYGVEAAGALNDDASVKLYLNSSLQDFQGGRFDRLDADAGLLFAPRAMPRFRARIGVEEALYAGSHLYEFPYASLIFIPRPINEFRLQSELKYGRLDVTDSSSLDAQHLNLTLSGTRRFPSQTWLASNLYLETAESEDDAYSYVGAAIGGELSVPLNARWGIRVLGSVGRRDFSAVDPLFGSVREDDNYIAGVSIFSRSVKLLGFEPEVGIRYEKRDSNLAFYDYDKVNLIFRLSE